MPAPVPEIIRPLLAEYLDLLDVKLPGFIAACYIQGSIALDAFNERLSDIDLIVFISRSWNESDMTLLKEVHRIIETKYPRWQLEVLYLEWPGTTEPAQVVTPLLQYLDGKFEPKNDFELHDVTWWVVKNRGITLRGPAPQDFGYTVDWSALIAGLHHNQNTYWAQFTTNPRRIAYMVLDEGFQWAVLGVLRQYYSFKENDITSKTGAGRYALEHFPPKWHRVIQEAVNIREGNRPSLYKSRVIRLNSAIRFLKYVRELCNNV